MKAIAALITGLLTLVVSAPVRCAQSDAAKTAASVATSPVFDVAVIRPNPGDPTGHAHSHIWSSASDGHFKAQNVTAMALIQYAFDVPETRIEGGPAWMRTKPFDLDARSDLAADEQLAKMPTTEARARKRSMLQALLADRFALKVHDETRTMPVYDLVVAKGGPKFQLSKKDGTTINNTGNNGNSTMKVQGSDHTLRLLAEQLGRTVGRVVVDETGLDGRFDLTLKWSSDDLVSFGPDGPSGPSLFTALEEQLGLKLEPDKGPVTILVVDHLELPSEN